MPVEPLQINPEQPTFIFQQPNTTTRTQSSATIYGLPLVMSSSGLCRDLAPISSIKTPSINERAVYETHCNIKGPFTITKLPSIADTAQAALNPPNKVLSVKLDAVYKPILRRFRGYFRDRFDRSQNKKSYIHWTTDTYIENVTAFIQEDLKLPDAL